jgi:hypothetical protein
MVVALKMELTGQIEMLFPSILGFDELFCAGKVSGQVPWAKRERTRRLSSKDAFASGYFEGVEVDA